MLQLALERLAALHMAQAGQQVVAVRVVFIDQDQLVHQVAEREVLRPDAEDVARAVGRQPTGLNDAGAAFGELHLQHGMVLVVMYPLHRVAEDADRASTEQVADQVHVMGAEIQHDAGIGDPSVIGPDAQVVDRQNLAELSTLNNLFKLGHGGVKALYMAHGDHLARLGGQIHQLMRLGQVIADRLLDQQVAASGDRFLGRFIVKYGRCGDRDQLRPLLKQRAIVGEQLGSMLVRQLLFAGVRVGHADQLAVLQLAIHPHVVPPHRAGTDYTHLQHARNYKPNLVRFPRARPVSSPGACATLLSAPGQFDRPDA